jgi:tetratricopeptide (TPR) repeat protein
MMSIDEGIRLAIQHHQAGRFFEAENLYRSILAAQPDHADASHLLGLIARRCGNLNDAEQLIRRAVTKVPTHPLYLGNLGLVLIEQKRLDEAVDVLQQTVKLAPDFAQAQNNLGAALRERGRFAESLIHLRKVIELQPQSAEAHGNLSGSLLQLGQTDEALAEAQTALQLDPSLVDARYNLGTIYFGLERFEEAVAALSAVTAAKPDHVLANMNLGNALRQLNRLPEAIAAYSAAVMYDLTNADAHWNLSLAMLMSGDFDMGWFEHEWRFSCPTLIQPQSFPHPQWRGESLEDRTILLHAEQGLGDSIQFVRYAPMVAERGAKVLLQCQAELVELFKTVQGIWQVIPRGGELLEFQFQCPLMSLPLGFSTTMQSIPATVPYLSATEPSRQKWKQTLEPDAGKFKVGLVWAGRPTHPLDRQRSIALQQLLPLAGLKNVQFISLQKGPAAEQLAALQASWPIRDLGAGLTDFADTAGLISQLDLVITVDTSVAHLAGAMGKPVWVLLQHSPDWRWMLNRDDSPWYPSLRLFRQTRRDDWTDVISRVESELRNRSDGV